MPFYDLRCESCGAESNIMASMADRENRRIVCPDCGSRDMSTLYKSAPAFIQKREHSPGACPRAGSCGQGCPHAR